MPHLSLEYSASAERVADIAHLCRVVWEVMVADPVFPTAGIRVRAHRADHAIVADGLAENGFVAMTLSVGAGREPATLKASGDRIFAAAQVALAEPLSGQHFALSLEIREIDPVLSWKDTPIHARLSGQR